MPILDEYRRLNNHFQNMLQKAMAWDALSTKSDEAHDYCRLNKVGLLGDNVWHAILADAIRMRKELESKKCS